jgi:hypothetical protein
MKNAFVLILLFWAMGRAGQSPFLDGVMIGPQPVAPMAPTSRIFVVVDSFLSPYTYSMGLGCDGRYIWNNTPFSHDFSRIDPLTHAVVNTFTPAYGNRDIAFDGTNLWASDWSTYCIYKYDTTNLAILSTYDPGFPGHAHGLAWDGNYLWVGEEDGQIYKMNTSGGTIRSIPSPATYPSDPRGLAFAGGHLWVGHQGYGRIYEIDTITGAVINFYSAPGAVPSQRFQQGVDFDGQYLWSTVGGAANVIYKIDIGMADVDENRPNPADKINLQVSPNPIRSNSRISFVLGEPAVVRLILTDAAGRVRAEIVGQRTLAAGKYQYGLPIERFPNGIYFAVLRVNDHSRSIKVIKL